MINLVFFLETNQPLSERQSSLIDLSVYLSKNFTFSCHYVNNFFSNDAEKLKNTDVSYIDLTEFDSSAFGDDTVYITPLNYLLHLLSKLDKHCASKICLFDYDVNSFKWLIKNIGISVEDKKLKQLLLDTNSCCYLNSNCLLTNNPEYTVTYLPVFTKDNDIAYSENEIVNPDEINIGYFGFINDKALNILDNLLDNLKSVNTDKKINIHLIGDASNFYKINIKKASEINCRFICTGRLKDPRTYIKNNVDIIIAYDENAVSASLFGVPVIITSVQETAFKINSYVYFYEVPGYNCALNEKQLIYGNFNRNTIAQVLNDIYNNNLKSKISESCYNYALENHSLPVVSKAFLNAVKYTSLSVDKLLEIPSINEQIERFDSSNSESFGEFLNSGSGDPSVTKQKNSLIKIIYNLARKYIYKKSLIRYKKINDSYYRKKRIIAKTYKKSSKKIKVGFIVVFNSVFPTRPVFEKMLGDKVFDPYIIVAPNVSRSYKYQVDLYKEAYNNLSAQYGDRVINGYDIANDEYLELKDEYGIMFFCNPYKHLVHPFHEIEYFLNKNVLPIYSSYGFAALKFWDEVIATDFYNFLWKACVETESNLEYLKKTEKIKGKNGIVTGYIKMDKLALAKPIPRDRKRILICPHHTVWGWKTLNISNFLSYYNLFLRLPELYPDIDFIFRPHPLLFENLKAHRIWTQKQIDEYLNKISEIPNMVYNKSGDYMQQFVDSDAMIHDCGSFIGEYLYTGNPCCYMMKSEEQTMNGLVPLGQECIKRYYHAFNESDILKFIEDVVINGMDPKKSERENFVETQLKVNYPNAAEYVIEMLKSELRIK